MPTFGEKLRQERERRETSLQELAAATGIGLEYLEALERNEIDSLPGPSFGKLYIRAYAERLEFDPSPILAEYESEVHRLQRERPGGIARRRFTPRVPPEPSSAAPAEALAEASSPERRGGRRWRGLAWAVAGLLLLVVSTWIYLRSRPGPSAIPVTEVPESRLEVRTVDPTPPPVTEAPAAAAKPAGVAPRIVVAEARVGRRVVGRRLEGESQRFAAGEVVYFWNRVIEGRAGDSIRHVWLRDGRPVATIELPLRSSQWRTYSKVALEGSGPWAAEARDRHGNLLARVEFTCE